jgi:osmotically-inducible protein OsmY
LRDSIARRGNHPKQVTPAHLRRFETPVDMFTDTHIKEAVRAALDGDPRIKHPELIAVSVDEIGTVVLRGAVGTPPERLAAAHDAREVEGVFDVIVDDLRVHPPVGARHSDDEVRAAALERLIADPRIHSTHVQVKVSHGHVTLSGYVRSEAESAAAAEDVAGLGGVTEVTNRIDVR